MFEMLLGMGGFDEQPYDKASTHEPDMDVEKMQIAVLDMLMQIWERNAPTKRQRLEAKLLRRKKIKSAPDETVKEAAAALEKAIAVIEKFTEAHPVPDESVVNK